MPNLVNTILIEGLKEEFSSMGSCLVVTFDNLTVKQDEEIRHKFREAGVQYRVVKNRLAIQALAALDYDVRDAFQGKCGVVFAPEESAIAAAKVVREFSRKAKKPPVVVTGGVIEGEAIVGVAASAIADMPDRDTVHAMLASAIIGPARALAVATSGLAAGLARCIDQRFEEGGE